MRLRMLVGFILLVSLIVLVSCNGGGNTPSETEEVTEDVEEVEPLAEITEIPAVTFVLIATGTPQPQQPLPVPDASGGGEDDSVAVRATQPLVTAPSSALSSTVGGPPMGTPAPNVEPPTDMFFEGVETNPFIDTEDDNLSTFGLDVDSGSYTVARNYILNTGQLPPQEAVRPEEFINYFDADYPSPESDAFGIYLDGAPAPYGYDEHYLLRVGVQARYIAPEDRDSVFLVFVIDVSGSMDMQNRLGTVKESLALLTRELREDDRVGIVVYSDNSRAVLEPTPASEYETIMTAINALQPEGSTNAAAGLQIGYNMALRNMREGQNTRVILLSDGVANNGVTDPDGILALINDGVEAGITLSTIGFGMNNYNDALMEQLANDGNGNYYYVDQLNEARRIFVHNLTGTLQTIGFDARIQVEFNPEIVDRYRLIGYENRAIADEDFRNDEIDAAEIGAGQYATALYEFALEDIEDIEGVLATVYVRYTDAETDEVVEISQDITYEDLLTDFDDAPLSMQVQASVAEFAEILGESFWAQEGNLETVYGNIQPLGELSPQDDQLKAFIDLVELAMSYQGN